VISCECFINKKTAPWEGGFFIYLVLAPFFTSLHTIPNARNIASNPKIAGNAEPRVELKDEVVLPTAFDNIVSKVILVFYLWLCRHYRLYGNTALTIIPQTTPAKKHHK